MPDLVQSLQGRDLGHLRIVADRWALGDLWSGPDVRVGLQRLAPLLLNRERLNAIVSALPTEARQALEALQANGGRLTWALFVKRFGLVREMGAARRDRDRPDLNPVSPAEMLWYRALVGQAFLRENGPDEQYAYIPDDLLALLPAVSAPAHTTGMLPLGRPATPLERAALLPADDRILDDACTLLAALRAGLNPQIAPLRLGAPAGPVPLTHAVLQRLLDAAGLLSAEQIPLPEPTRLFLEAARGEALAALARAWLGSPSFNELRLLPGLSCEGDWQNDPVRTRQAVLDFLAALSSPDRPAANPGGGEAPFWNLAAFSAAVKLAQPDFQRPAGDYDSWYIRREDSETFLRGFDHWDAIDGELLRFMICGPLYWLGLVDLAAPAVGQAPLAFRLSRWAVDLLNGAWPGARRSGQPLRGEALPPRGEVLPPRSVVLPPRSEVLPPRSAGPALPAEQARLLVRSDGRVLVPEGAPRAVRYQLARFCRWEETNETGYAYRLTPASLERARGQGLRLSHLLSLLRRHAASIPPALARALDRWEEHGLEARLEQAVILRVNSPETLQALRGSKAARFLGDPLGPTSVILRPGAEEKVLAALLELGTLAEGVKKSPE